MLIEQDVYRDRLQQGGECGAQAALIKWPLGINMRASIMTKNRSLDKMLILIKTNGWRNWSKTAHTKIKMPKVMNSSAV